jgi:hypothetical protein
MYGMLLLRSPCKSAVWLSSSPTTNGFCVESGIPCSHGQLIFKPRSIHKLCSKQTDAIGSWLRYRKDTFAEIKECRNGKHVLVYRDLTNEVGGRYMLYK